MTPLQYVLSAFVGTERARREHAQALRQPADLRSGLAELQRLCPAPTGDDDQSPIFLLSAGWRSGSTLLQRLLMSDPRVMIWGEPYDECGPVQAMAGTLKAFRPGWPPPDYYLSHHAGARPGDLADDWIANLFPAPEALRQGHRAFFEASFAEPARQAGFLRWGIKEVRLGVDHAYYLKWLYPNARFIFLVRNPLDAYISYCRYGRNWYDTWPDRPVFTPRAFGEHWRALTESFVRDAAALGALLVRYEDLIRPQAKLLERVEDELELRLDRAVLGTKVGSSEKGGRRAWVSRLERHLLRRAVSPTAATLGYAF